MFQSMHTHPMLASGPLDTISQGLLASPPVLFFFLGAFAAIVRSNLSVPKPVTKLLSLYLLWAIGFKGGVELARNGIDPIALRAMLAGVAIACITPLYAFALFRRVVGSADAAALAATYGSISAVTFMACDTILEARGIQTGGHMVATMALMESPAIVIAVLLLRRSKPGDEPAQTRGKTGHSHSGWGSLLHESFLNGAVVVLLGSLLIGMVTGERGYATFKPLATDLFPGVLVFFLLDLGLLAVRRGREILKSGWRLISLGVVLPLIGATIAWCAAWILRLPRGDAVLLMTLAASASYIAVPAAMRLVIPQARAGLYVPMALAVTFPFNIALGIPLYLWASTLLVSRAS